MKDSGLSIAVFLLAGVFTSTVSALPVSLFDGRSFKGWGGPLEFFRIEDGGIVGGSLDKKIPNGFSGPCDATMNQTVQPERGESHGELVFPAPPIKLQTVFEGAY